MMFSPRVDAKAMRGIVKYYQYYLIYKMEV